MKNIILLSTLVLAPFAFAQGGEDRGPRRGAPPHILEKFDADGDGELSKPEREAARAHGKAKREEMREFRKSFDTDGDGKLNEAERASFKVAKEKKILEHFDADKDGTLNADEQARADKAKKHMKERRGKRNKDGKRERKGPRSDGADRN